MLAQNNKWAADELEAKSKAVLEERRAASAETVELLSRATKAEAEALASSQSLQASTSRVELKSAGRLAIARPPTLNRSYSSGCSERRCG